MQLVDLRNASRVGRLLLLQGLTSKRVARDLAHLAIYDLPVLEVDRRDPIERIFLLVEPDLLLRLAGRGHSEGPDESQKRNRLKGEVSLHTGTPRFGEPARLRLVSHTTHRRLQTTTTVFEHKPLGPSNQLHGANKTPSRSSPILDKPEADLVTEIRP